jgi:hypothetical protein
MDARITSYRNPNRNRIMKHPITIAGRKVELEWTQRAESLLRVRASKIGANLSNLFKDFQKPTKAEYAVTAFIWLLLPSGEYASYPMPEDLYPDLAADDAAENFAAVLGIIGDMTPDAEKKSSLTKSPSPESS